MLLVYSRTENTIVRAIRQRLNGLLDRSLLTVYSQMDTLTHRLRQPRLTLKIGVLCIDGDTELDQLVSVRELLADIHLIVILPDHRQQMLSKAHLLAPRLVAFRDAGMTSLLAVIERLVRRHGEALDPSPRVAVWG